MSFIEAVKFVCAQSEWASYDSECLPEEFDLKNLPEDPSKWRVYTTTNEIPIEPNYAHIKISLGIADLGGWSWTFVSWCSVFIYYEYPVSFSQNNPIPMSYNILLDDFIKKLKAYLSV